MTPSEICVGVWVENYPLLRVTTVQQEITTRTSPLCFASTLVVSALHFSVLPPSTKDLSRDYQEEPRHGLVDFLKRKHMPKLRKVPVYSTTTHWVSKVWNHIKNLALQILKTFFFIFYYFFKNVKQKNTKNNWILNEIMQSRVECWYQGLRMTQTHEKCCSLKARMYWTYIAKSRALGQLKTKES